MSNAIRLPKEMVAGLRANVSQDANHRPLMGFCIKPDGIEASSGHTLVRYEFPTGEAEPKIIPVDRLKSKAYWLAPNCEKVEIVEDVRYAQSIAGAKEANGATITPALIEGPYADTSLLSEYATMKEPHAAIVEKGYRAISFDANRMAEVLAAIPGSGLRTFTLYVPENPLSCAIVKADFTADPTVETTDGVNSVCAKVQALIMPTRRIED